MKNKISFFLVILLSLSFSSSLLSCTAFRYGIGDRAYVGKSFDFDIIGGDLIVNPRGIQKKALHGGNAKFKEWTSRFGSVTFNMIGKELPLGGMNEESLVVEISSLDDHESGHSSDAYHFNEAQFIQYLLDNFKSVDEILPAIDDVYIKFISGIYHFSVCDKTGKCVTIDPKNEYGCSTQSSKFQVIEKKYLCLMVYQKDVPYVASNSTDGGLDAYYSHLNQTDLLRSNDSKNGALFDLRGQWNIPTEQRYSNARYMVENIPKLENSPNLIDYGFKILKSVKNNNGWNKWQIVYDLQNKEIHFRANKHMSKGIKTIDFKSLDFSQGMNSLKIPIDSYLRGNIVKHLKKYSPYENRKLAQSSLTLCGLNKSMIEGILNYLDNPSDEKKCVYNEAEYVKAIKFYPTGRDYFERPKPFVTREWEEVRPGIVRQSLAALSALWRNNCL